MKALTCEMCGSTNLLKQDGVFVCQSCGTKYSVEEAKRMMVEGTVDVKGTVKVDTSDELKNLYEIARRARDTDNSENAAKYYDMILVKDPNSWEANFYVIYYKAMSCKIIEIESAANSISNCLPSIFQLIQENVTEPKEQELVVNVIVESCIYISKLFVAASKNHYIDCDASIRHNYMDEYHDRVNAAGNIPCFLAGMLETLNPETYKSTIVKLYKLHIELKTSYHSDFTNITNASAVEAVNNYYKDIESKIKKYEPSYTLPQSALLSVSGCYVATAVYGSYDCPEVWTLRRFRDNTLAETWYGRAFVHTYYAISPRLVKWFGHTEWFKKMWKEPLDSLVRKLQSQGFENTPYNDRIW